VFFEEYFISSSKKHQLHYGFKSDCDSRPNRGIASSVGPSSV
jgi:hypothetical protein